MRARAIRMALLGVLLGFVLSRAGYSDFGELHRMLTLADPRLLFAFAGAVAVAATGFFLLCRGDPAPHRPVHRFIVPGAVLFGAGWAVTGACPTTALVQLGEGRAEALLSIAGVLVGVRVGQALRRRHGWDSGSCA